MARPQPPPYAALIAAARLAPPKMTITEAARRAGLSDTRWSQLESGYRMVRRQPEPEWAPAETLARMARAVGVTPAQLEEAGRADAAAELAALPTAAEEPQDFAGMARMYKQLEQLAESQADRLGRLEEKIDRYFRDREPRDDQEDDSDEQANGSRRAG